MRSARARSSLESAIERADAVIVRLPSEVGLAAGDIARRLGKPLLTEVVACVGDGLRSHGRWAARLYAPLAVRRMQRAVARSDWTVYVTAEFLQRRYPSSGQDVAVSDVQLPTTDEAVLERRLRRISAARGPVAFGMVAAMFHDEKRVDVAIRALAAARRSGAEASLTIAGPGDVMTLGALAERLGVRDHVHFVGVLLPGRPVFDFLDGVDVYLQTSYQEGLPRALLEALSRALPALGSDVGGTRELLSEPWLHQRGDVKTLAAQIVTLSDRSLHASLARQSFARSAPYGADQLDQRRELFWRRFCDANGVGRRAEPVG
jgi:glycosyltransferase involved in cell wall biosynthesis